MLSAIGPGDVVKAFRDWTGGVRTMSETSITFSSQEFDFFARHDIPFWVISSHPRTERLSDGANRIENRPRVTSKPVSGLTFHVVQLLYALSLLLSAIRFRATHAIIDSGTTHWFTLSLFRLAGIEPHPNFHNVYWPVGHEPRGAVKRAILRLDGFVFRHSVRAVLGVSPECGQQAGLMSGGATQFVDYRIQFEIGDFGTLPPPVLSLPMRIMFAGRVEENKGVFDILTICELLSARRPNGFVFDICGSGGASDALAAQIATRRLGSSVTLHGKLVRPDLLKVYGRSHLVIVPTRSTFCEGLPGVCAEAVIAGRPVLTSRLSNALEVLRGALVNAREDDPTDYAGKIEALADDPDRYSELVRNTALVRGQFLNPACGLTTALERCLLGVAHLPGSEAIAMEHTTE
ncbi:MAG: glycosyltransferase family 4 protein [Caldimonas sp.]